MAKIFFFAKKPRNPQEGEMMKIQSNQEMALVVIDVQKGLFEKSTPIYGADQFLENINRLIAAARQAGVPVIFVQHSNENTLVKGSDAWQLHPKIKPLESEEVIQKTHGNAFEATNLREILESWNVGRLIMTGLVTHGCVKATCLGAIDEGYKVVLVRDGHSNYSKDAAQLIDKWNHALSENGAELIDAHDVKFTRSN
jgi:nicotinamidase-related amidase